MKRLLSSLLLVLIVTGVTGCATQQKMALDKSTKAIAIKDESVLLMTAKLKNDYKPSYQPEAVVLYVEKPDASSSSDRLNFLVDPDGKFGNKGDGNEYAFRFALKPGKYILRGIGGVSGVFPIRGNFFLPLHSEIDVKGGGISYLGKVVATVRERKGDEFRAGLVIPLVDQAATGFSGGTFEVSIVDAFNADMQQMLAAYPALQGVKVDTALLSPFDRAKAQQWWKEH